MNHQLPRWALVYSLLALTAYLSCYGLYFKQRPFDRDFLQGDATYNININYTLSQFALPESTFWVTPENAPDRSSGPLTAYITGHVGSLIHWAKSSFVPMLIIPLLYSLYPEPPMHVFVVVLLAIFLGYFAMLWGIYRYTGSITWALICAHAYVLSPWVVGIITNRGYWDLIGFGILPWFLLAMINRNQKILAISGTLFAASSLPLAMFTAIIAGVVIVCYCRMKVPIFLIFFSIFMVVLARFLVPYCTDFPLPKVSSMHWLASPLAELWPRLNDFSGYFSSNVYKMVGFFAFPTLLVGAGALLRQRYSQSDYLALSLLCIAGFLSVMARDGFHRFHFFSVPAFILFFIVCYGFISSFKERWIYTSGLVLFGALLIGHSFRYTNGYRSGPTVVAEALGWQPMPADDRKYLDQLIETVEDFHKIVPQTASVAFDVPIEIEAIFANRRYAWYLDWQPETVDYVISREEQKNEHWNLVQTYSTPYQLYLYRNTKSGSIPRIESTLGYRPLLRALKIID